MASGARDFPFTIVDVAALLNLPMKRTSGNSIYTDCPLCGEFDGIVVPSLLAGNLIIKCWQMHAHARTCGVVIGAKVPVALTSRSDSSDVAFLSLAFCAAMPRDSF